MPRLATLIPARIIGRQKQIERNLTDAAALLERETKRALSRPYPRASRPGEAPAARTKNLMNRQTVRADLTRRTLVASNTADYAEDLLARGRVWTRPVFEQFRQQVDDIVLRRGFPFGGAP